MLGPIRKFSSSVYAKIFLFIVAIPFVFWGMGPVFQGGKQNIIVEIGKEKFSTQEFIDFVRYNATNEEIIDKNLIEKLLSNFIGEKLTELEIVDLDIKLSDNSLSIIIRNEKAFKKENKFSRTEYEKFLVKNGLNAATFEAHLQKQAKRDQLFEFIGGGVVPSKFLVNIVYDKINQKRNIQIINLNDVFKQKLNFSENQIKSYFNQNVDAYKDVYKSVNFTKLNPKNLTGNDEFNDLFFQKIDEIDDLIAEGKNLNYILKKFDLVSGNITTFDKLGMDMNSKKVKDFPTELVKNVFGINEAEPTIIIEHKDNYFIVELTKTENVQGKITDQSVKKEILLDLKKQTKRKLFSEIVAKINNQNFKKNDFDQLSKDENIEIKKIKLNNQNDNKVLKQELVNQVYTFSENKVAIVTDIDLSESFLIYVDKIENASINMSSEDYNKYSRLSKVSIVNKLYNTYDSYLNSKYKININYKALSSIENYFR